MILIDGVYINKSGGKILLELLMHTISLNGNKDSYIFLLDKRFESDLISQYNKHQINFLESSEKRRRDFYNKLPSGIKSIFCFANVPPPVPVDGKINVFIYFHNILLLNSKSTNYSLKARLLFYIKRIYIKLKNNVAYTWLVQTPGMKTLLAKKLGIKNDSIALYPFYQENEIDDQRERTMKNGINFLYVADGVKQKNHLNLLEAWKLVIDSTKQNLELHLTVPENFKELCAIITKLNDEGYKVINHGYCDKTTLKKLYSECNFLVFPSFTESFGLPLIEAALSGCEIISSDLPYIYDVIKPLKVFNPYNINSIANSILDVADNPHQKGTEVVVKNEIQALLAILNK